jgi:D-3-phosphoglycerate dehydrogenase
MDFLEKGDIVNSVNFPKTVLPLGNAAQRLTIAALNNSEFAAQVAKIANISAMAVQTRGEISYAIIELSKPMDVKDIAIDGLVKVRVV